MTTWGRRRLYRRVPVSAITEARAAYWAQMERAGETAWRRRRLVTLTFGNLDRRRWWARSRAPAVMATAAALLKNNIAPLLLEPGLLDPRNVVWPRVVAGAENVINSCAERAGAGPAAPGSGATKIRPPPRNNTDKPRITRAADPTKARPAFAFSTNLTIHISRSRQGFSLECVHSLIGPYSTLAKVIVKFKP